MSYFRPMGDGPVTDPSQIDPSVDPTQLTLTVTPTRVDCSQLSADSPFRQPGQVCAPAAAGPSLLDFLKGVVSGGAAGASASAPTASSGVDPTQLVWLAGLGAAGYYAYRHYSKRRR